MDSATLMGQNRDQRLRLLDAVAKRALWLACWTIHNANHLRRAGEVKVSPAAALLGHAAALLPPARVLCALSAASSGCEVKPAAD